MIWTCVCVCNYFLFVLKLYILSVRSSLLALFPLNIVNVCATSICSELGEEAFRRLYHSQDPIFNPSSKGLVQLEIDSSCVSIEIQTISSTVIPVYTLLRIHNINLIVVLVFYTG